jgi:hypothetical protein
MCLMSDRQVRASNMVQRGRLQHCMRYAHKSAAFGDKHRHSKSMCTSDGLASTRTPEAAIIKNMLTRCKVHSVPHHHNNNGNHRTAQTRQQKVRTGTWRRATCFLCT